MRKLSKINEYFFKNTFFNARTSTKTFADGTKERKNEKIVREQHIRNKSGSGGNTGSISSKLCIK